MVVTVFVRRRLRREARNHAPPHNRGGIAGTCGSITARNRQVALLVLALGSLSVLFYSTTSITTSSSRLEKPRHTKTVHGSDARRNSTTAVIQRGAGQYQLDTPTGVTPGTFSWSQYGQDTLVDDVLQAHRGGFFLEIGGYDGEKHSNTLFFETQRGWEGLLVEANPHTFHQMLARDRTCGMVQACISNTVPSMTFHLAGGETTALSTASAAHLQRIHRDVQTYGHTKQWHGAGDVVTTPCYALGTLLESLDVHHVDYFSLDVEGAEVHILNSIDFERYTFGVLSIEVQENRQEIHHIMTAKGYERFHSLQIDDFYQPIVASK